MTQFKKKFKLVLGLLWIIPTGNCFADMMNANPCIENSCCYPCQIGHLSLGAELLYWRAFQDGLDICIPTDISNTVLSDGRIISTFKGKSKDPSFEWNPGFRIGADYEFICTNWDIGILWTHFNSRAHRSLADENNLRWHINFDVIDLLVAYQSDFNSCFSLRPYLGVRAARIDQKLRLGERPNSTNFAISSENIFGTNYRHNLIGIGPLFGVEIDFRVGYGFSLYANGAISWLYGRNHVKLTHSIATTDVIDYCSINNNTNSNVMGVDAFLGIRWQTCFCSNNEFFLQFGFEHHRYFDYSRFGRCGDLSFDGLSFGIGLGF